MKRTFSILAIFSVLTLSIIYSCRSGENGNTEMLSTTESLYNKKESTLLQKKYGFVSISNYVNKTDKMTFNNIKSSNSFSKNAFSADDLDLTKVTETVWEDAAISYTIVFKNSTTKFLVVSVKKNETFDVNNGVIIENLVDNKGNGEMFYTNVRRRNKTIF
ncbi:hypothetical protein [Halpernia frigidisoli]|uniref:Lipoprotein n=1 Tax=Halpernia frigidisoli TaxID=1125876 RepID=A0A1I3FSD9_9FLAO|nr:hypothetical protein [Halpernia frigidisoli]SFI14037.1 hypothetical protein SAMN05443292_1591 [Halpernia frigidisoli]